MKAKTDLMERIEFIEQAVRQPYMIDEGISKSSHNGTANLHRRGLGIIAFNTLEDFIKERFVQALDEIANTSIQFEILPDKLKSAVTLDALVALENHARRHKSQDSGDNWLQLVQEESLKIHSAGKSPYSFSKYSLLHKNSNVSADDVSNAFNAIGIKSAWDVLQQLSKNFGTGIPNLRETYKSMADRRHLAAHSSNFSYNWAWLEDISNQILSITAAIDILLSSYCQKIHYNPYTSPKAPKLEQDLSFCFLEYGSGSLIRQTTKLGGRAQKIWPNLPDAKSALLSKVRAKKNYLLVINEKKQIVDWQF